MNIINMTYENLRKYQTIKMFKMSHENLDQRLENELKKKKTHLELYHIYIWILNNTIPCHASSP